MINQYKIAKDNINLYVTLEINPSKRRKFFLFFCILLMISIPISLITIIDSEPQNFFVPISIISFLIFYFIIRYFLWNIYGKENIIINNKTISYNRDFGLYQTKYSSIKYSKLDFAIQKIKNENDLDVGDLVFIDYLEDSQLPEVIFQTSILIPIKDLKKIQQEIELHLFDIDKDKLARNNIVFSQN